MRGSQVFRDRRHAGRVLGLALLRYARRPDVVILALPRGGVPVAFEVADKLGAPLDILLVRKLGAPGRSELAMGALASGGAQVLNREVIEALSISAEALAAVIALEQVELARRELAYRGGRAPLDVSGRVVILVDDGLATGATMRAAIIGLRSRRAAALVVAVPTAAPEACALLAEQVDDLVCPVVPEPFRAVGASYADFGQTSDAEVRRLLRTARRRAAEMQPPARGG